jgi:hypothetical protein
MRTRARTLAAILLAAFAALALLAALPPAPAAGAQQEGRALLVGVTGLAWDDVSATTTPQLWRLSGRATVGSVSVRTVRPQTCPADGWLTIGAGRRSIAYRASPDACVPMATPRRAGAGSDVRIPGWAATVAYNGDTGYDPQLGLLGETARRDGACTTAIGPGGALALADRDGLVPRYRSSARAATREDLAACRLTVVDAGTLPLGGSRAAALKAADAVVGRLVAAAPPDTTVVVTGVADDQPDTRLRLGLASGPDPLGGSYGRALLSATSTRQNGLVQLTDITPTLLAAVGRDAGDAVVGAVWDVGGGRPDARSRTVEKLAGQDAAAQVIRDVASEFFLILVIGQLLLLLVLLVAARRAAPGRRDRLLGFISVLAVAFGAMPSASYLANLAPWWRASHPVPALALAVLVGVCVVTLVGFVGPWRRYVLGPAGAVAGVTMIVLAIDVATGSHLQLSSLMGLSPLVAGRFYGFGNVAYAVFAISSVLVAAALAAVVLARGGTARRAAMPAAAVGVVAVIVDGWPTFGSDFGGVLALVPAFAVLALLIAGVALTPRRVLLIAVGAVLIVTVIATLDWLRPPASRSHLGDFVQSVIDGDAAEILLRKVRANLGSLGRGPVTGFGAIVLTALIVNVVRAWHGWPSWVVTAQAHSPTLRPAMLAVAVAGAVGFAVNDSGLQVPAVALTVAVPLVLAAVCRAVRQDQADGAGSLPG